MIKRSLEALLVAAYWFAGSYVFAWWTPYALQAGALGVLIGVGLLLWPYSFEDRAEKVSPGLGCAIFAPPLTLLLIGAITWLLEWLVLP